jgi:hypothetical protein
MTKATYKIKNWSSYNTKVHHACALRALENQGFSRYQCSSKDEYWYNKSLIERGSINLWPDDKTARNWFYRSSKSNEYNNKVGSPDTYSNSAIELCLTVRAIYKLPL